MKMTLVDERLASARQVKIKRSKELGWNRLQQCLTEEVYVIMWGKPPLCGENLIFWFLSLYSVAPLYYLECQIMSYRRQSSRSAVRVYQIT